MLITFLVATLLPHGGVAQAGESLDLDISEAMLSDWKQRGIALPEGDPGLVSAKGADPALAAEVQRLTSELEGLSKDYAKLDADHLEEQRKLQEQLQRAKDALELAGDAALLAATVKRNADLADAFDCFVPDKEAGLSQYNEAKVRALAVYLGIEGDLPELKADLVKVVWSKIKERAEPKA